MSNVPTVTYLRTQGRSKCKYVNHMCLYALVINSVRSLKGQRWTLRPILVDAPFFPENVRPRFLRGSCRKACLMKGLLLCSRGLCLGLR